MTARDAMNGSGSVPAAPEGHEDDASGRIGAGAHPCSDKALWIPAFAGMTAQTLVRHSREGGNPVILLWNFPVNSLTDHGCAGTRSIPASPIGPRGAPP